VFSPSAVVCTERRLMCSWNMPSAGNDIRCLVHNMLNNCFSAQNLPNDKWFFLNSLHLALHLSLRDAADWGSSDAQFNMSTVNIWNTSLFLHRTCRRPCKVYFLNSEVSTCITSNMYFRPTVQLNVVGLPVLRMCVCSASVVHISFYVVSS